MRIRATLVAAMLLSALTWPGSRSDRRRPRGLAPGHSMSRSRLRSSAFRRGTCRIEPWEDGVQFVYDLVRVRGGITHLEWRGRADGRDQPLAGVEVVVTVAYTRVDERTYHVVQKVDGQVAATATMALSPDGKSITTTTTATDAQGQSATSTTVYDKP